MGFMHKPKKIFMLLSAPVLIAFFALVIIPSVFAGCCQGPAEPGFCKPAASQSECVQGSFFDQQDCSAECFDEICCCYGSDNSLLQPNIPTIVCEGTFQNGDAYQKVGGSCSNVCPSPANQDNQNTFSVSGIVFDQDQNPIPNSLVEIAGQSARASANGEFSLQISSSNSRENLVVSFPSLGIECSQAVRSLSTSTSHSGLEIFLECLQMYQCSEWSSCIDNKKTRDCAACDASGCNNYPNTFSLARFPEEMSICTDFSGTSFCTDQIIDSSLGEQCFADHETGYWNPASSCSFDLCYGCLCTAQDDCIGGNCDSSACEQTVPAISSPISYTTTPNTVTLEWGFGECAESFDIQRCIQNNPTSCNNITAGLPASAREFTDSNNLKTGNTYCYKVFVHHDSGKINSSLEECITITQLDCLEKYGSSDFCYSAQGDSYIASCTDQDTMQILDSCSSGEACIVGKDGQPSCQPENICETCNSVYGFFPGFAFDLLPLKLFQNSTIFDSLTSISCQNQLEDHNYCFFEKTTTSINKYESCGKIGSCYDYESKGTCEGDPCNKQSGIGQCEWIYSDEEAGIGVCRPAEEKSQNCAECHSDFEEDFNENGFDFCTSQNCPKYAGLCYYSEIGSSGECIGTGNKKMGCEFYNTEKDCADSQNMELQEDNTRIESNDLFGFGDCRWDDSTGICFKDADESISNDCTDDIFSRGMPWKQDSVSLCYYDNTPPQTFLSSEQNVFGTSLEGLAYWANDDSYEYSADPSKTQVATLFSLSKMQLGDQDGGQDNPSDASAAGIGASGKVVWQNQDTSLNPPSTGFYPFVYPSKPLDDLKDNSQTPKTPGWYMLRFYSVDLAGNLEVVQEKPVLILSSLIISGFSHEQSGEYSSVLDKWLSTLQISFEASREAVCTGTLESVSGEPVNISITDNDPDTAFEFIYQNIQGGIYSFTAECTDAYGSKAQKTYQPINLQNNLGILSVLPEYGIYSNRAINIALETNESGSCRISQTSIEYSNMETALQAQGTTHTYMFNAPDDGVYKFYSACDLSGSGIIEGFAEDMIVFAVDTKGPEPFLRYADIGENYNQEYSSAERVRNINLKLDCSDDYYKNKNQNGKYLVFSPQGCENIYYKINNGPVNKINSTTPRNMSFSFDYYRNRVNLEAWAEDAGGNIGTRKNYLINLADVRDVPVQIRFAD